MAEVLWFFAYAAGVGLGIGFVFAFAYDLGYRDALRVNGQLTKQKSPSGCRG